MARALLISKHQTAEEKVDKLFELLDDPSIAWDAAKAIGGLVKDDKVLTKQNYAVVKVSDSISTQCVLPSLLTF